MLIVCYDISDDKLRTQFSKFLDSYGVRLQYSVFELNNTNRILNLVKSKVETDFAPKFGGADSIIIFSTHAKNTLKYGHVIHRDQDLIFL